MTRPVLYFLSILIYLSNNICDASRILFTSIRCHSFDLQFSTFSECRIYTQGRNINEFSVRLNLLQTPVDNVTVIMQLMKKTNDYNSYIPDVKIDGCQFMRNGRNPLFKFLYAFTKPFTNINHTCPYNHDIVVERLRVDKNLVQKVPLPSGDYALYSTWMTNNVKKVFFQLFLTFKNK